MNVILLEKIQKLGELGDQIKVKSGFGRNYLIPKGKAVPATKDNVAKFAMRRAELEKQQKEALNAASARVEKLNQIAVSIERKAGSEGKLFGSVGKIDIAEAVTAKGVPLEKNEIHLPDGPIRMTGEYSLTVRLHADVEALITVHVVPEETN